MKEANRSGSPSPSQSCSATDTQERLRSSRGSTSFWPPEVSQPRST